jgi:three-Cys-motif partner protein
VANEKFFDESREQSQVKSTIVRKYFWACASIITRTTRGDRIAYIDLFAGPGRYNDGTVSTPLLILQHAINDPAMQKMLVAMFNDANAATRSRWRRRSRASRASRSSSSRRRSTTTRSARRSSRSSRR